MLNFPAVARFPAGKSALLSAASAKYENDLQHSDRLM
jgi:hypothetical protein